ncbi:hypothetical protein B0A48_03380 [Cryoendolithus antarcticus]|uniref:Uncharacterized protein n=1 Tax=Cryoendolithus antarcticus TaxID=1507870 RepID=A0A1V8TJU4_9PEZI|nr:hypothetical protein B0A48_03380 [Cryoendolithus antarcticus]
MADQESNQNRFYRDQEARIMAMFQDESSDWDRLTNELDEALADPFLPRLDRANFHAIRALSAGTDAQEHIDRARTTMQGIVEYLKVIEKSDEEIEVLMAPLKDLVDTVEGIMERFNAEGSIEEEQSG